MPTLFFIRHGETDWNRLGRLQGQTETPLNARGRAQAKAAARHLRAVLAAEGRPDALAGMPFHVSPMLRTRETASILRAELGLDPDGYGTDDRLKEVAFGDWEGRTWADLREREPGRAREREADRWNFTPPGGESYAGAIERVRSWLSTLSGDCCVIAHGGTARLMMVALARVHPGDVVRMEIWQGKVLRLDGGAPAWLPGPGHH
jgi:probable phosphoglycerate mutase